MNAQQVEELSDMISKCKKNNFIDYLSHVAICNHLYNVFLSLF